MPFGQTQPVDPGSHDLAREAIDDATLAGADLSAMLPAEQALVAKLAEWPRFLETAAKAHEPHRIATYLQELAADLHGHYYKGNKETELRFLQDDPAATQSKIALARAVAVVISAGLGILGVTPATEMR